MKKDWDKTHFIQKLYDARDKELATTMEAYMKNHFVFLGIKSPERLLLMKEYFSDYELPKYPEVLSEAMDVFLLPEREFQYAAIFIVSKYKKKLQVEDLSFFEQLILSKSWWDTVDSIAPTLVGDIVLRNRKIGEKVMGEWSNHSNKWLNRASLLHMLKYKEKTDEALMTELILKHAKSTEFFLQKAIGWLLREYSKTNPSFVQTFVSTYDLAPLSKREAVKHIEKDEQRN
ncbi:DNA alkylation repair protein [Paenisporosarcina cavernae]|uniref:DNA alkylation repair protein n=1 Tax=Paenisporosarcina cavernae TaxID=2320858 RepID=A0A385YRW4_9BACL|nr:DNA alkylation repair protein [Paenisporosarcina cavernae]AYC29489.1 DNA alkylation repair protein [Paenisporosarcina cavernae]